MKKINPNFVQVSQVYETLRASPKSAVRVACMMTPQGIEPCTF